MLYFLLFEQLLPEPGAFRVFGFITVRTALASFTALGLSLMLGPWLIGKLREFQISQYIREEGPKSHQKKEGTPTMGGLLIIVSVVLPTLLWADWSNVYVWIALAGLLGFALIGFLDDYAKVTRRQNLGLTARAKMTFQILITAVVGSSLLWLASDGRYETYLQLPFFKNIRPPLVFDIFPEVPVLAWLGFSLFFLFLFFVLVGSSNAVNLTDGLDGLAIGLTIICCGALTVLTYVAGHREMATYLDVSRVPLAAELTIFCGALVGASLGFLWYNAHPAEVFMGDVGALGIGGAIGVVAVLIKQEIVLLFVGGVFVLEALSVILQVGSYKLRGKRIFRMAPLHHHFEALGWTESKIIVRFWIAGLIWALLALGTLKLR